MKLVNTILLLVTLLLSTQTYATVYENAEDGNTNKWHVYDNTPQNASINNIYIGNKSTNVIEFVGNGINNGYILGNWEGLEGAWENTTEHTLNWDMNFNNGYVVYVRVMTRYGARYIYYTPSNQSYGKGYGGYIHIGLGRTSSNGTWQSFSRDLAKDLIQYEPDNRLIAVNAFLIRGNGFVDNIALVSSKEKIYGLTLDDISDIDETVDALKSFAKRTTTRVVFDEDKSASDYTNALNALKPYTDIMGELFDSEYIAHYSVEEYTRRVRRYLNAHGDKVKIWEIGNEVNGEWTGNPNVVAQKTINAYKEVKNEVIRRH